VITQGHRSPRWVEGHKARLRIHLIPFFGEMGLSEVTAGKVQEYRIHRIETSATGKPPARSTMHDEIVTLRQTLKTAMRHGWLQFLPDLHTTSQSHLDHISALRIERDQKTHAAVHKVQERFAPRREVMRNEQHAERRDLKNKQSRLHIRIFTMLDLTGITRRRQEAARKELSALHKADRKALSEQYRESRGFAEHALKTRYVGKIENQKGKRLSSMARLQEQHRHSEIIADRQRQQRELEREHMSELTEKKIETWRKETMAS